MNCHAIRAVLDLHAEGRLTPKRAKAVAAHLESCAECRAQTTAPTVAAVKAAPRDFKERLAASLKAPRVEAAESSVRLLPRDLSGVAYAVVALLLVALAIGWSGVPSQKDFSGDELAAGRNP